MKKLHVLRFVALIGIVAFISACQESLIPNDEEVVLKSAELKSAKQDKGFIHAIVLDMNGTDYYLAGAPHGPDGKIDVPGHYWVKAGKGKLVENITTPALLVCISGGHLMHPMANCFLKWMPLSMNGLKKKQNSMLIAVLCITTNWLRYPMEVCTRTR